MDWLVRGCILVSINAERNIVDQGMKLPILYDPLGIMTWYFHKKEKEKENENKQGGNGLLSVIWKLRPS